MSAEAQPAADFNRLARVYRWLEMLTFGSWLQRSRLAFLDRATNRKHALVLGDGDGRFTARLLAANRTIQIDAVDASPAMLRELLCRAGSHAGRVRTVPADARLWTPERNYELVATHFFLDCLTTAEIQALAARLRPSLRPDAVWLVSEFAVPESRFGRFVASPLVRFLYVAFRLLTGLRVSALPDHRTALTQAGFVLGERRTWLAGLLVSERWMPLRVNR